MEQDSQARKVRVMVVEDETLVREVLVRLLGMEPDIDVVGRAGDGESAVKIALHQRPDVVLMDIQMPQLDGIAATQQIKAALPTTGIVILTIYRDDANVFRAIKAGAQGYVLKDSPPEETLAAIRAVARGDGLLSPSIAARVMTEFSRLSQQRALDNRIFADLTDREREVLKLVAEGKRNREIGARLYITEKTVKNHVSSILSKLQANDRTEAAIYAARQGLVDLDSLPERE